MNRRPVRNRSQFRYHEAEDPNPATFSLRIILVILVLIVGIGTLFRWFKSEPEVAVKGISETAIPTQQDIQVINRTCDQRKKAFQLQNNISEDPTIDPSTYQVLSQFSPVAGVTDTIAFGPRWSRDRLAPRLSEGAGPTKVKQIATTEGVYTGSGDGKFTYISCTKQVVIKTDWTYILYQELLITHMNSKAPEGSPEYTLFIPYQETNGEVMFVILRGPPEM